MQNLDRPVDLSSRHVVELLLHLHLPRPSRSVLPQHGSPAPTRYKGQQSGDGEAKASCAHSRSLHIDPGRPDAVTGVSDDAVTPPSRSRSWPSAQAFEFTDELKIGGSDAVSSSPEVVNDRLGSLSYHKPDHPTLNAAAALRPTRANCRWWRSVPACRLSGADQLHATFGKCLFPNPIFYSPISSEKSRLQGPFLRARPFFC